MEGHEAGPSDVPVEDGSARQDDDQGLPQAVDGDLAVDMAGAPEARVDDEVREPDYGFNGAAEHSDAAHGSHGNHEGILNPVLESGVPSSGRQRPVPDALDDGVVRGQFATGELVEAQLQATNATRPNSRERRSEDVGQVARSLAYMTSLVTTLAGRMERVEQAQSRTASSAGRRTTTSTSARMETPMGGTPEAGTVGWFDMQRLGERVAHMMIEPQAPAMPERPLASLDAIFAGTFSSDDSETARMRANQAERQLRGVPGALLGPLAAPLGSVSLSGDPNSGGFLPLQDVPMEPVEQSMQSSGMPQGTALQLMQSSGMPQGTALQSMQSSGMPQGTALQSMQSSGESQGTALSSMQSSGMPQGTTLPSMQSSGKPQGTTLPSMQSSGMPQGTTLPSMQSSGMPQGTTLPSMQSSGMPQGTTLQSMQSLGMPQRSSQSSMPMIGMPQVSSLPGGKEQGHEGRDAPGGCEREGDQVETPFESVASEKVQAPEVPSSVPPGIERGRGQGLVIGAPPTGLVYVDGSWRPYMMVQGQMVIQAADVTGASVTGLSLAAPNCAPTSVSGYGGEVAGAVQPPPPPPPPRTPTTPRRGTTSGNNATPGGTPIPPPPPTTPAIGTSACGAANSPGEVEEPSKLVTKLPPLMAIKGTDAAVVAGDWLAQLEPSMASLSSTASTWWQQIMGKVRELYQKWLESTPVDRLQIRQGVLADRPPLDRYQRVEQRASMLLLDSLPEDLKAEAVSVRAVTVLAMVFLVHCSFQPGGSAEKAFLLHFLTSPDTGAAVDVAVTSIRKRIRLLRRGKELQVVLPDPSLLCRGLDKLHAQVFTPGKYPSAAFRIASFKLERQLDYKAKASDVEDYAQLILGELEAALLAQPLSAQPKLNRMEESNVLEGSQDRPKGKGKGKGKQPCWAWSDGSGCKYGQACMFRHDPLGPGHCWVCGSSGHLKPQCPYAGQGGAASSAATAGDSKNAAPSAPGTSSATTTSEGKGGSEEKPPRKPRKKGGGKAKDAVRKAEDAPSEGGSTATSAPAATSSTSAQPSSLESARDEFFEEAAKALKSLRLARATLCALGRGSSRALVDSGATTSMRTAGEKEVHGLPTRRVLLAEGEATFYQLPGGTLLTERRTSPIVAMSDLMEIGCRVAWSSGEGCQITHPTKGDLQTQIVNGCPEVNEQLGLELIKEAEAVKLRRREAEVAVNKLVATCGAKPVMDWDLGAKAVVDLRNGVGVSWAWLRRLFPGAPSWLVSAVPVVASMDGTKVPWNRRERKRWRQAAAVGIHLFCGRDRTTWKSTAEATHVVTVDQAEDIMADDTYAALLDLALSGKVKTVFGGPPCRTFSALRALGMEDGGPRPLRTREGDERWGRSELSEWETWRVRQDAIMIFRMLFLWMVAAAVAKGNGEATPDFIMEHPEDPKEFMKPSQWALPEYQELTSLWAFPEFQFLKSELGWHWWQFDQGPLGHPRRKPTRILSSVACPSGLRDVRGPSVVSEEERDHDGGGFRSASWASWAPRL